jgi:DNA polymerase-3 subunit gamma/tau
VPDAVDAGLIDAPDAEIATMREQTGRLGIAQLSRAADLVNVGLSELKGATAPRLQLELLCARLLLPAADDSEAGLNARIERLEHRVTFLGDSPAAAAHPRPAAPAAVERVEQVQPVAATAPEPAAPEPAPADPPARPAAAAPPRVEPAAAGGPPAPPKLSSIAPSTASAPAPPAEPAAAPAAPAPAAPAPAATPPVAPAATAAAPSPAAPSSDSAVDLGPAVSLWPSVLEALKSSSRVAHTLAEGTVPVSRTSTTLVLAHPDRVRMGILRGNKGHLELLRLAVLDVARLDVELDIVLDPDRAEAAPSSTAAEQPASSAPAAPAAPSGPSARERAAAAVAEERATTVEAADDVVSADDDDVEDSDITGLALVQRELGGTVMTEYDNG